MWSNIESPFRAMDEFDVFMDPTTRKISINTLVEYCSQHRRRQFIFISPQDQRYLLLPFPHYPFFLWPFPLCDFPALFLFILHSPLLPPPFSFSLHSVIKNRDFVKVFNMPDPEVNLSQTSLPFRSPAEAE
jgi:hypothetical protein